MLGSAADGRGQAVPSRALRRVEGGPAGRLVAPPYDVISARAARGVPGAEPVQRRSPDAAGRRGGGRPDVATGAKRASSRGAGARATGSSRRTTSGRTAFRARAGWSARSASEPYERASSCRTSARIAGPKRAACGCCARRGRSSSRSSCSTRAAAARAACSRARPAERRRQAVARQDEAPSSRTPSS